MTEKQKIYDEICKVLTDWETQDAVDDDLYWMLVKVQKKLGRSYYSAGGLKND